VVWEPSVADSGQAAQLSEEMYSQQPAQVVWVPAAKASANRSSADLPVTAHLVHKLEADFDIGLVYPVQVVPVADAQKCPARSSGTSDSPVDSYMSD